MGRLFDFRAPRRWRLGVPPAARNLIGVAGLIAWAMACGRGPSPTAGATPRAPSANFAGERAGEPAGEPTSTTGGLQEEVPVSAKAYSMRPWVVISPDRFCITSGRVLEDGASGMRVERGGMRGVVAGGGSRAAEVAFTYFGPSVSDAPLASGEVRRQMGLSLRKRDSCNAVYAMWHIEPKPAIVVLVKSNPAKTTHSQCGAKGYIPVHSQREVPAPVVTRNAPHTLRAELSGAMLDVYADQTLVWEGNLPPEAFAFDGPAGVRSDNGIFNFAIRAEEPLSFHLCSSKPVPGD